MKEYRTHYAGKMLIRVYKSKGKKFIGSADCHCKRYRMDQTITYDKSKVTCELCLEKMAVESIKCKQIK